jgi:pyruvate/2-oxoglutarate dehydrogenase complex dihydrolipoamide dehydrogenase (E3) component
VVLNTGTALVPPIGLADNPHLDNEGLLALRELPRKLVIIGGGYISLEMGQIFRRLGSKVAIIETGRA